MTVPMMNLLICDQPEMALTPWALTAQFLSALRLLDRVFCRLDHFQRIALRQGRVSLLIRKHRLAGLFGIGDSLVIILKL